MGKKVGIVLVMIILLSISILGCLGDPGDIILGANDIPGEWEKITFSSTDNSASRGMKAVGNQTYIYLAIVYYASVEEAEQAFQEQKEIMSPLIASEPDLGDDCFMVKSLGLSIHSKEVYCRIGFVYIVFLISNYYETLDYSDQWVLDIVEMQLSRL